MASKTFGNQYFGGVKPLRKKGNRFMPQSDNFVEAFRDIGDNTVKSIKDDLLFETPKNFINQLFGQEKPKASASGEIMMGGYIEIDSVIESQKEENLSLQRQLTHERNLRQTLEAASAQQTNELKLQLKSLMDETEKVVIETVELSQEIKIATMQAPVNSGIYHIIFFEKLLTFIKQFRKKIHQSSLWLQSQNKIAAKKKTFWGQVGKSGAKRLLSTEDYSQRSAG
jgi:hypothetical protein